MTSESGDITHLVTKLASHDPAERTAARQSLVDVGKDAVPALLSALENEQSHVRWEAAKTLQGIGDTSAAEKLVAVLGDEEMDVRWVAAEALAAIGADSLAPVLDGLSRSRDSEGVYKAAHHVLTELSKDNELADAIKPVLAAFKSSEPQVSVPVAALKAMQQLQ